MGEFDETRLEKWWCMKLKSEKGAAEDAGEVFCSEFESAIFLKSLLDLKEFGWRAYVIDDTGENLKRRTLSEGDQLSIAIG